MNYHRANALADPHAAARSTGRGARQGVLAVPPQAAQPARTDRLARAGAITWRNETMKHTSAAAVYILRYGVEAGTAWRPFLAYQPKPYGKQARRDARRGRPC